MIIKYASHLKYEINPGKVMIIATDNPTVYYDLITGVTSGNDKVLVIDDEFNKLTPSTSICWLGDILNLNLNKEIELTLKHLAKNLNEQQINSFHETLRKLFTQVQDSLFMTNVPLKVTNDGDLLKIFKYCNVKLDDSISNSPYGIIKAIINMHLETGDSRPIGLTNVAHYLTSDQFQELSLLCLNCGIPLIFLEFTSLDAKSLYRGCDFYHIDADFVDWH